ncbi:Uncharacterised protein [uncultured archaeon]|nr:Uncharacterised protein [uncultured archaeon]
MKFEYFQFIEYIIDIADQHSNILGFNQTQSLIDCCEKVCFFPQHILQLKHRDIAGIKIQVNLFGIYYFSCRLMKFIFYIEISHQSAGIEEDIVFLHRLYSLSISSSALTFERSRPPRMLPLSSLMDLTGFLK